MRQDRLQQDTPTLMAKAPAMQQLGTGVEAQYLIELDHQLATLSVAAIRPCPPHTKPPPAELEALEMEEDCQGAVQKRRGALEEDTGDLLQALHLATGPRELLPEKRRGVSEEEEATLIIRDNQSKKNVRQHKLVP